jgi:broad specificity phosphatase PhoE
MCRHGESDGNAARVCQGHSPGVLTQRGERQAKALGRHLWSASETKERGEDRKRTEEISIHVFPFDRIWCSDLNRVQQTYALAVTEVVDPVLIDELRRRTLTSSLLREKNAGIFEGRPRASLQNARKRSRIDERSFCPPRGESWKDVCSRAKQFLSVLIDEFKACEIDSRVLVFTSGGFIKEFINGCVRRVDDEPGRKVYPNCAVNCCRYIFEVNVEDTSVDLVKENLPLDS